MIKVTQLGILEGEELLEFFGTVDQVCKDIPGVDATWRSWEMLFFFFNPPNFSIFFQEQLVVSLFFSVFLYNYMILIS